jgi:hypothetical protein
MFKNNKIQLTVALRAGLPEFSWYNVPKWEEIYQTTINYIKWSQK